MSVKLPMRLFVTYLDKNVKSSDLCPVNTETT